MLYFHTSAKNINCGYSLEPPHRGGTTQSMFSSRNRKNDVNPCKPQFYYNKVGFNGVKLYTHVFVMNIRSIFMFSIVLTQFTVTVVDCIVVVCFSSKSSFISLCLFKIYSQA